MSKAQEAERRVAVSAAESKAIRLDAAHELARRLRERPEDAHRPAVELAREFGLSKEFVEEFLEGLAQPPAPADLKPVLNPFIRGFQAARAVFRRLTAEPLKFIGVTTILSIAAYLTIDAFLISAPGTGSNIVRQGGFSTTIEGNNGVFLSFAFGTLILHLACYFRHGMMRYPLFGGLICWLISAPVLMVLVWLQLSEEARRASPFGLIAIAIGMLVLNFVYAAAGAIAAVWGGAWRIRLKDREQRRLSRQDLLERMFDVQERLQNAAAGGLQPDKAWERWSERFNRQPYAFAIGAGLLISLTEVLLFGVLFSPISGQGRPPPLLALLSLSISALWLMLLVFVGFFSNRTLPAIFNSWLFVASGFPPMLIPVGQFGPEFFVKSIGPVPVASQFGFALVVAAVASAGGRVEQRAQRERRLLANDPAALLAELVRLQWQLSPQTSDVCVMVVDAAGSAEMKAMADHWAVEYSFREYQAFLEQIVHAEGGSVLSTAGDGAIAEFQDVHTAYRAARKIQTHIDTFNRRANKLDKPFRVRVGLHMGPVTGSINDVEFSAVIDIAAHVQAAAPVGGIAMTGIVAEHLQGQALAQLAEPVDGQSVFIAMQPTEDA